jgi:putative hemolysin
LIADLIIIGVLLAFSAYFSGSETAFVSANTLRLYNLRKRGNRSARFSYYLLEKPERLLSTTLVGNNVCLVLMANLVARSFHRFMGQPSPLISIATVTVLVLLFGEVLPKNTALRRSDQWTRVNGIPMYILFILFYPAAKTFSVITRVVIRLIGIPHTGIMRGLLGRKEDVRFFLTAHIEPRLTRAESRYFLDALEFSEKELSDIMIPLVDLHAVPLTARVKDCQAIIAQRDLFYLPVFDHRIFNIIGVVFTEDLYKADKNLPVKEVMRDPVFMPENKNIGQLYRELYERDVPLVFAVDEFGGITGMATMYDIGEEIIGRITGLSQDSQIIRMGENEYLSDGDMEMDDLNHYLGIELQEEDITTLNGFLSSRLGRIPQHGDSLTAGGYTFVVEKSSRRQAQKIRIRKA